MAADWQKLTIQLTEVDASRCLGFWAWLIDRPVLPVELTRFGDWFLLDQAGTVHRLDILEGTFAEVCGSATEFRARRSRDAELVDWYQDGMVYAMYASGLCPGRGQGFGYLIPPVIGGALNRENVMIVDTTGWQLFMAQLHDKLRAAPPGSRIQELKMDPSGNFQIVLNKPRGN